MCLRVHVCFDSWEQPTSNIDIFLSLTRCLQHIMANKVVSDDKTSIEIVSPELESRVEVTEDEEFGGTEERKRMERKLLWRLDCRMSSLIVLYILNYVCVFPSFSSSFALN